VVLPSAFLPNPELLRLIGERFDISRADGPVQPNEFHQIGMYAGGEWFVLRPRIIPDKDFASGLDASILQEQILAPVFGIDDPVNDNRLKCIGGAGAMSEIKAMIIQHPDAVAFTLAPLSVGQLMQVAEAGEILPPKSTWINPKVPYGLLLYQHEP